MFVWLDGRQSDERPFVRYLRRFDFTTPAEDPIEPG
jgi:hypothetical protein